MTQTDATRALAIFTPTAYAVTDCNLGIMSGMARLTFFEKISIDRDIHWLPRGGVVMPLESLIALKDLLVQECAKIEITATRN